MTLVWDFPRFASQTGTSLQAKRVGAPKVRYPSELVSCGRSHATFAYAHSNSLRSLLEDLSQRTRELWKVSCESSPASAGVELTAPFCHANRLTALRAKRQESALIKSPSSLILSICHFPSFLSYVLLLCSGVTFFMISSTNIGLYIVL